MAQIKTGEFLALLRSKERKIVYEHHATIRADLRSMNLSHFDKDIKKGTPLGVIEQSCETAGERKFKVYYPQKDPYVQVYVIVVNDQVRLITLMRPNINRQKDISKGVYEW